MKIQEVINLVEETLMEISKTGGQLSTGLTDKDFQELKDFIQLIHGHFSKHSVSISLREVNASINSLTTKDARDYVFGKTDRIKASPARSSDRGDEEKRIAAFAGPDRNRNVSEDSAEKTSMVAEVLEKMRYIDIDEQNQKIRFTDKAGLSRVQDFVQTFVDKGIEHPTEALKKFEDMRKYYQSRAKKRLAGREPEFEGSDVVKEITPNILIFLSQVAKNNKRKKSWDSYLNPENYEKVDSVTKGYFEYNPREAAESLVQMGLATKGDNGYLLNKEKIQQTVSAAQSRLGEIYKDAKLENPVVGKSSGISKKEQKARQFINVMKNTFSGQVWQNAQKHVFSAMRNSGELQQNALDWYLGAKDSVSDESNQEQGVRAGHEKVNKTYLGTIIDFLTAKFIAKKMKFDAAKVLGKNVQKPAFITGRDLSLVASAFKTGAHKKPSRV